MENKENVNREAQELTQPELEQAVGGSFIDDAICFFDGHGYDIVESKDNAAMPYMVKKLKCYRCGKLIYERDDRHGTQTDISAGEYNSYV